MRLPRTKQQEHNDFVRRMTGGTLYGRVRSAAPISPHTRPTRRTAGVTSEALTKWIVVTHEDTEYVGWSFKEDASVWTYEELPLASRDSGGDASGVTYNSKHFLTQQLNGMMNRSVDGINWHNVYDDDLNLSGGNNFSDAAYGKDLWVVTARGFFGDQNGSLVTSPDASADSWTERSLPSDDDLYTADYNGSVFLVAGANGAVHRSSDGISWTQVASISSERINDIHFNGGRWLAVGHSGGLWTSDDDGDSWTSRNSGTSRRLMGAVSAGNGLWIVTGVNNDIADGTIILKSTDNAETWSDYWQELGWGNSVDYGYGIFVVATRDTIIVSEDGESWTDVGVDRGLNTSVTGRNSARSYTGG